MSSITTSNKKMVYGSILIGACAILCIAIVAKAQYNTFDSDSNSDSDGNPILTQAELGKLVRNSGRFTAENQNQLQQNQRLNQQQAVAATRNLYNRQQPLQYAPSHNKRSNYGGGDLNGYGPSMRANSRQNADNDDDEGESNFGGPNFGSNFDNNGNDGEGNNAGEGSGGQPMNLNQAASGYPGQGDYSGNDGGASIGFGFGGASNYGPSNDGSEFGPSDGFNGGEGRRAKSASSPMSSRGFGNVDDDAGAPQYGPNSAVNGDEDDRAGYAPEGQNDNDNDDE